jgi:eukaryotic-like serine/threonine-protein kinase
MDSSGSQPLPSSRFSVVTRLGEGGTGCVYDFDEQRLRGALGQLARCLHALHRAGKVHRDIKPSDILVTLKGRVVLLDFGILSDVEEGEQGVVLGTAGYMAPEQARGAAPSPEADW